MNARRIGHRAEHAALHRDHLERGPMVALVGRAGAVRQQQALVAAIVGVAHRRVHADVGRDAGERDVLDALAAEQQVEIGGVERSLARLVDDRFARQRRELGNELPARLAANENLSARARIADARADALAAPALVRRQIAQIGPMPLARVHDVVAEPRARHRARAESARSARA